jgi:hypothetical protein
MRDRVFTSLSVTAIDLTSQSQQISALLGLKQSALLAIQVSIKRMAASGHSNQELRNKGRTDLPLIAGIYLNQLI